MFVQNQPLQQLQEILSQHSEFSNHLSPLLTSLPTYSSRAWILNSILFQKAEATRLRVRLELRAELTRFHKRYTLFCFQKYLPYSTKIQTIDILYSHPIYACVLKGVLQMIAEHINGIQAHLVTCDFPLNMHQN